tara:strand:+ start:1230 stop:1580 length:351 start_codon:yes stop_codon:yes gene_type:complete
MPKSHHEILESQEKELVSSDVRKDRARMEELLADDFQEYGSSGRVFQKLDVLDAPGVGATYKLSDFTFRDLAQGVTLVRYRSVTSSQTAMRSSIWVQASNRWQLLHHQATVVPNAT